MQSAQTSKKPCHCTERRRLQLSATDKSHSLTLAEWKSDQPKAPSGAPLHRAVNQPDRAHLARATRAVRGARQWQRDARDSQRGGYRTHDTAAKIVTVPALHAPVAKRIKSDAGAFTRLCRVTSMRPSRCPAGTPVLLLAGTVASYRSI